MGEIEEGLVTGKRRSEFAVDSYGGGLSLLSDAPFKNCHNGQNVMGLINLNIKLLLVLSFSNLFKTNPKADHIVSIVWIIKNIIFFLSVDLLSWPLLLYSLPCHLAPDLSTYTDSLTARSSH